MDAMNTNPLLDCKTMLAILNADPDGVAIIGAWNSMETLAREDPEGFVRLSPGLPMDNTALAGLLHCRETIVEKTVAVFEKLKRVTVKDGLIKVLGLNETKPFKQNVIPYEKIASSKTALSESALAKKRELARLRQAERRARQKQEKEQQKENVAATPDEKCDEARDENRDLCDNVRDRHAVTRDRRDTLRDMCDTQRDNPTQSRMNTASAGSVTERDTRRDSNTVNSNINNNLNALNALKADKHVSIYETENEKVNKHVSPYEFENEKTETKPKNSLNPSGNCVPWHPEENGQKIPLNLLPEPIRNVINEYNKLPLPKYNGIIPSLLEKMKYLLHRYGERIVIKTIAGIANMRENTVTIRTAAVTKTGNSGIPSPFNCPGKANGALRRKNSGWRYGSFPSPPHRHKYGRPGCAGCRLTGRQSYNHGFNDNENYKTRKTAEGPWNGKALPLGFCP